MDKPQEMEVNGAETDERLEENNEKPTNKPDITLSTDEPLLGSVTTYTNADGVETKGQQLRSSARVFKKMKLDLSVPVVAEKPEKQEETKPPDVKKCHRPPWTSDEKTIFFEALNEFGRDFESIQTYINNRLRKKGVTEYFLKTKDQVRQLYSRTWHKVSKHLRFSEGIKRLVQELYALINYGELRKKVGAVSEKTMLKLQELVYRGSIVIRSRGKNIRVKTPMCKALRRLNQIDEKYDEIKLPKRITVDLHPKNMLTYLKVQRTAQNPRLRSTIPLQTRLCTFIECVSKKWRSVEAVDYDNALIPPNAVASTCMPPAEECEINRSILNPPLRLTPPEGCKIELPAINLVEYFSRQSVSLNTYEQRIGIVNSEFAAYAMSKLTKTNSKKSNRQRTGSTSEKCEKSPQKNSANEESDGLDNNNEDPAEGKLGEESKSQESNEELKNELNREREARIAGIRKGWTLKDCDSLTLGEIYLMIGSDTKMVLEYSWDDPPIPVKPIEAELDPNGGVEVKMELSVEAEDTEIYADLKNIDISDSLMKLLSAARLHYRKNMVKCPCGHICGTNTGTKKSMKRNANECNSNKTNEAQNKTNTVVGANNVNSKPTYKVPILPTPNYNHHAFLKSQIDSIQRLKPKYCNRKGRVPRKQVVVERRLPLLPNRMESGHQIVRMNIISQENSKSSPESPPDMEGIIINETTTPPSTSSLQNSSSSDIITKSLIKSQINLELVNENTILGSAPPSPSRILKEDNQWISSEVADYSLSSLLGHLESPVKAGTSSNISVDSRISHDVDAHLRSLLTESSLDFTANFADLAAQVTQDIQK